MGRSVTQLVSRRRIQLLQTALLCCTWDTVGHSPHSGPTVFFLLSVKRLAQLVQFAWCAGSEAERVYGDKLAGAGLLSHHSPVPS